MLGYSDILRPGYVLDLERTFYVPSFSRNLISVSRLVLHGFSFNFVSAFLHLLNDNVFVGDGILYDGLFRLYLNHSLHYSLTTMHDNVGIKCSVVNERSFILWHRRLGHISIERVKRLVNDGVLKALHFTDFDICVDYKKESRSTKQKRVSGGVLIF